MRMKNHRLTLEERKEIERLSKTDLSLMQIANQIGRGKNSIAVELRRSGGRANYNAEEAQKLSDERLKKKATANCIKSGDPRWVEVDKLIKEGLTFSQIKFKTKISYLALVNIYKKLGLPITSLHALIEELNDRIYALEEQVKLLFEITNK